MWLRDSMNQLMPYMSLLGKDDGLKKLVAGAVRMQATLIQQDPYANAFKNPFKTSMHINPFFNGDQVKPAPGPNVWESKYELDSLASFLRLSNEYIEQTKDVSYVATDEWKNALKIVHDVVKLQQRGTLEALGKEDYTFSRQTDTNTETLYSSGLSAPVRRCGLVKSAFRPSDDATLFPYLIPANAMLSVELGKIAGHLNSAKLHPELAKESLRISKEVNDAIYKHAVVEHPVFGQIIAYEVNGFGSVNFMDDANVPSLLSLPYLGFLARDDPLYLRTRKFVLSEYNPYRFTGSAATGIGGPHVGLNKVWPMATIMRALTSNDTQEISDALNTLKATTADTGFMHESFNVNDPKDYTRPWFAWANGLFGELIKQIAVEHPSLIF